MEWCLESESKTTCSLCLKLLYRYTVRIRNIIDGAAGEEQAAGGTGGEVSQAQGEGLLASVEGGLLAQA